MGEDDFDWYSETVILGIDLEKLGLLLSLR